MRFLEVFLSFLFLLLLLLLHFHYCSLLGYLYFHQAPDAQSFHEELVRRVKNLHYADCLRAHKSTLAWGVEARVPFLDKVFFPSLSFTFAFSLL